MSTIPGNLQVKASGLSASFIAAFHVPPCGTHFIQPLHALELGLQQRLATTSVHTPDCLAQHRKR